MPNEITLKFYEVQISNGLNLFNSQFKNLLSYETQCHTLISVNLYNYCIIKK